MTLEAIVLAIPVVMMVPSIVFALKLMRAKVQILSMLACMMIIVFGIGQITTVVSYAVLVYAGWKAQASPMPGTNIGDAVNMLRSEAGYCITPTLISAVNWYTGMPYRSVGNANLITSKDAEALERARLAWQPAMLFCCILHLVSIYGYMVLIYFLRTTVT